MYLEAKYQVMFDVGAIISGGGAMFEYEYNKSNFIYNFEFSRWIPYLDERYLFEVDLFREGYRRIFVVAAKQEVRREATFRRIDKYEHGPLASVGRSAVWPEYSWRCRCCVGR